jgi:predicted acetyltransferase
MKIKQISVFLENKKGRLAQLTKILKENNIDISAISVADTANFGIIRMIVSRYSDAMRVIKDAGYTVNTTDVLAVEVLDPLLEWNNNRFSFAYKNDGLSVLTTSNPPDFEIPISTLTQLLWGYYTPWQAMQHGLIKTFNREKIEDLDILFPKTTPYIYEDY